MMPYSAKAYPYKIALCIDKNCEPFPYLRDHNGDKTMFSIGSEHGRSYVIGENENNRWIVSKGNGLSYTQYCFLNTAEFGDDTLGLLLRKDAERDFLVGQEIASLGIKTNEMEYVLEIEKELQLPSGHIIKPILLQYNVECPYRISDACHIPYRIIEEEVSKWEKMNDLHFDQDHLIAANVLIRNLHILHKNQILHNAIHAQNYTWALELLDFELACSPQHPYDNEDSQRHVKSLYPREVFYTYLIICQIAEVLHEVIDNHVLEELFNQYGFSLKKYNVPFIK